ncbi:MAG: phage major capsid protein [Oscillospiraceae bacterium]|nr:phage major capsid protein [Oscillospiraceae bacterium]
MSYDNLRLEKGMYTGDFTANLEKIDPSENYRETPLAGLDAFERQLKRFDIHVSGPSSDRIDKFFQSSDSAVLFPEYMTRAIKQGMKDADVLSDIVATVTQVDAPDYRPLAFANVDIHAMGAYPTVNEGAPISAYEVKNGNSLVNLQKRGRVIKSSYEALRFHRLELFTVFLKQLGAQFARERFEDALAVLMDNPPSITRSGSNLTYGNLCNLWANMQPANFSTLILNTSSIVSIFSQVIFQDSAVSFTIKGEPFTPFGAKMLTSPSMPALNVLAVDKTCALEMISAGDVLLETNKLIDHQFEQIAVSSLVGFAKIMDYGRLLLA